VNLENAAAPTDFMDRPATASASTGAPIGIADVGCGVEVFMDGERVFRAIQPGDFVCVSRGKLLFKTHCFDISFLS
jgi:hypothetical protein